MPTQVKITQIKEGENNPANLNKMENKLTEEELKIFKEIAIKEVDKIREYCPDSQSESIAEDCYMNALNLLWPYVKEMYEQGYNDGLIEEGMPLIMEERFSNVLNGLKSLADAK